MHDFSAGDTVQVGLNGEKGKITDIVHPLGTYCMYKVQLFNDGQIITVAKHELVKGLPDHLFNFEKQTNQSIAKHTVSLDEIYTKCASSTVSRNETDVFEDSVLDDIDSTELNKLLSYVDNSTLQSFDQAPYVAEKLYELPESKPNLPLPAQANRFVRSVEIDQYLFENENSSTRRKTLSHQKLLENYLALKNEHRPIQQIPASELDVHISQFFIGVCQKNGQEYEPVTLRSMLSSFERYLKRHNYGISLITGYDFSKTREVLKCKQKDLKKQGRGNKPHAADEITDEEIDLLYDAHQLGPASPSSLINTLWFNNTLHFGMRAGAAEHRNLCWGDLKLHYDDVLKCEYIEYHERQTKTRTGEDIRNVRPSNPRMYATGHENRCPVMLYKKYASKRPYRMQNDDSPFYLALVTNSEQPAEHERWFISQPIGVNKINNLMAKMTEKANLPSRNNKRLTNTSVRKHLCQKLLNNNVPDDQAAHVTGHKNPHSLNNYRKITNRHQQHMSRILSSTGQNFKENVQPQLSNSSNQAEVTEPAENLHRSASRGRSPNVHISQSQLQDTSSFNIDSNRALSSIFGNSNIYGGTFNVTLHIDQPKRPRIDQ